MGLRVSQGCTAELGLESSALQQLSAARRPCSSGVPTGSMSQQVLLTVFSKVVSDCITAGTDAQPSSTVQVLNGFCHVDAMGLPSTLPCPVANLLCQITGDNSDAIGGQLCFLTSGSGAQQ